MHTWDHGWNQFKDANKKIYDVTKQGVNTFVDANKKLVNVGGYAAGKLADAYTTPLRMTGEAAGKLVEKANRALLPKEKDGGSCGKLLTKVSGRK